MKTGATLARVYKKSFWNAYDHILTLIFSNLLWFVIFPLPTFLWFRYAHLGIHSRIFTTVIIGLLANAYALSGIFGLTARITRYEKVCLSEFFHEAKEFYLRTLVLSLIYGGVIVTLVIGIRFYAGWKAMGGLPGFVLAGWQLTMLVFVLLLQAYVMPLATLRDEGVWQTIKWSAILTILKPGYTVLIFLQAVALFALVSVTGIGLAVLAMSIVGIFLNSATRELWRQIEEQWKPSRKPTSWKEIFRERQRAQEEERTLRDLFHPWDG